MAGIPITRQEIAQARCDAIRTRVQSVTHLPSGDIPSRLARPEDADAFYAFLSDPAIHAPIYSLPSPLTIEAIEHFIQDHLEQRAKGVGLLFLRSDADGAIMGYSDIQVWPQWAAAELGGAIRPDRQGQGAGITGAKASFTWMFEALDIDVICETAAPDNIRTAKLLDHLGFERKGEITSTRENGTTRPSLVWEVTRGAWG